LPIAGLPIVLTAVTRNPFWLPGIAVLTVLGRWLVARDHNRPRVLYLALMSGVMFADRRRWGGASVDPLGETRHGD
jgi:type IV secretory pathway VirB3-like protein